MRRPVAASTPPKPHEVADCARRARFLARTRISRRVSSLNRRRVAKLEAPTPPRSDLTRSSSLSQGTAELFHDHAWVRNRAWVPRMAWQRLTDSEVAVAGREHRALELATVAALGAKAEPRADDTAPDAVFLWGIGDEPQPIQVSSRRAAWRTLVEERATAMAGQRPVDHFDPTASPFGGRKPYRGRVEARHSQVVGEGAVRRGPEYEVRPAARVLQRPARREGW